MKLSINFDMSEKETSTATEKAADLVGAIAHSRVESLKLGLGFLGQFAEATRDLVAKAVDADIAVKNSRPVRELRDVLRQVQESEDLTEGGVRISVKGDGTEISAESANFADEKVRELARRLLELEQTTSDLPERIEAVANSLIAQSERNTESLIEDLRRRLELDAEVAIRGALEHPDHGVKAKAPRKGDNGS